ncbi:YjdF family protein [Cytobacillus sp. Hz8]|uniref:YjdF family protein n=1 Tax=Cytobacillus sp. Hz8 TaxID=3347168 RepID=UPI0035D8C116
MKLTIYYDGQFFVGVIEVVSGNTLKAYRYVFGAEPNDQEVLVFVHRDLQRFMEMHDQEGIAIPGEPLKKVNPKRLQRIVSKEMKRQKISTKAQKAISKEYEQRKKQNKSQNKHLKDELKKFKREQKIRKAKIKHRGK